MTGIVRATYRMTTGPMSWLCLWFVVQCALTPTAVDAFSFVPDAGQGFKILVGQVEVFHHSKSSPMLYLGHGTTRFPTHSGNFYIQDYVSERIGLTDFETVHNSKGNVTVRLSRGDDTATVMFTEDPNHHLMMDITLDSPASDRMWLRVLAENAEEIYGGGEQFSYFNLRHRNSRKYKQENVYPIWTSEQGVGRNKSSQVTFYADNLDNAGGDYYTTYFPQPSFVSSRNYFFHHTGSNYAVLDFRSDSFHEIAIHGPPGRIYISTPTPTLMDTVVSLTSLLGRMPKLPDWVQGGAILAMQGGTDVMMSRYQYAKDNKIPVAGLWIQDWSGEQLTPFGKRVNWNWKWDPSYYPGLDQVIKNLTKEGVRVMAYINPNLDSRGSLFKEGASKGYLIKNSTGGIYLMTSLSFVFGSVDFTNPKAFDWYKEVIKTNMVGLGLGGWMADFGEYLPVDAVMSGGQSGMEIHNDYPRLWALCNKMALEETGKLGDIVYFSRAGFTGISNATTLMWAGDQNVDFSYADGLKSAITGALSMAMSGTGLTHYDLGGYTTFGNLGLMRTEELLLRSAELAIFGPVFRAHEGNQAQYNVQWYTNTTTKAFARLARAFAALKEYRVFTTDLTSSKGIPTQRPFVLHYKDFNAPDTHFFFGPDLFVCPVYESGVASVTVAFPPTFGSKWVHVWSGKEYDGNQSAKVMAPVGSPAAFYKSDSQYKTVFERLEVMDHFDGADTVTG